jgi:hypothetical protein
VQTEPGAGQSGDFGGSCSTAALRSLYWVSSDKQSEDGLIVLCSRFSKVARLWILDGVTDARSGAARSPTLEKVDADIGRDAHHKFRMTADYFTALFGD